MLKIIISGNEFFDEATSEFFTVEDIELELEHSLVSMSKWESKFKKPFLTNKEKSLEEIYEYFQAMILSKNVSVGVLSFLTQENLNTINAYIESSESATTFGNMPKQGGFGEVITSELIYYWMIAYNIPFECQYWHLNRLFALIRICNLKNSKPKKMSRQELAMRNQELNTRRRAELNSTG